MTKEELSHKIEEAKKMGRCCYFSELPTISDLKYIVSESLEKISETKIIEVYCNPKAKLWLLAKFWLDDFNYLGSRIKVISEPNMITGISIIVGSEEKYNYLILADGETLFYAASAY